MTPLRTPSTRLCDRKTGSKSITSADKLRLNAVISRKTHKMVMNMLDNVVRMFYTLVY